MATFVSPVPGRSGTVTPGERRFGERLRLLLEDDYLCWFNVPIGPRRQYPDFVVLHPSRGMLVLEVKDWRIDQLRQITKASVEFVTPAGAVRTVTNPLEQARAYCMTIVNLLSADSQLQQPGARYRGKVCFPYGYGVVLTNITRRQLDNSLPADAQELVLPGRLVFCKDEITETAAADEFQERLWAMFHYSFPAVLSLPQIAKIRWHLFPEIRIGQTQLDLLEDSSSSKDENLVPDVIRVMDLKQEQLARSIGSGHRVIHGVAGSGKTLILGYRGIYLAQLVPKPVLVLCFNITLAARLRTFFEERGLLDRVQVYHFHEWCKLQLTTYHVSLLPSDRPIWERHVETVIHGTANGHIPRAQYGAVLIDEGHDFEPDWLRLVSQMIDPESDSLLLLYDDAQSIYRRRDRLGFSLSSVGIKAQGRTTILRLNYRNTREILGFAYDFATTFLSPTECDDDHVPVVRPEAGGINGPPPAFRFHPSVAEEAKFACQCVAKWSRDGTPLNEIAIAYFQHEHGILVSRFLAEDGIKCRLMATPARKRTYDPRVPEVAILPVPSSKGLEFQNVIIIGVGHVTRHADQNDEDIARLLYVGITRARHKLLITASAQNHFVERLTALAA